MAPRVTPRNVLARAAWLTLLVGALLPSIMLLSHSDAPEAAAGPAGLTAVGDQLWHQDVTEVEGVAERSDLLGSALAAGDFNGDGELDLAVGVLQENVGAVDSAGAVAVLYGSAGVVIPPIDGTSTT